jgi:hypothetical protein
MGKVHGSLARAGKVKSQTPKVRLQPRSRQYGIFDTEQIIGRAPGEAQAAQGTCQEENPV